jgi:hypothetical protein
VSLVRFGGVDIMNDVLALTITAFLSLPTLSSMRVRLKRLAEVNDGLSEAIFA